MSQQINLTMYLHLIQRGGTAIILSMEIKPRSVTCSIEGLTNCEVENEFLYASGTLPCHRDTNCIEITVKIGAAEIVDNIQLSIG
ncbi:unnamed protein product [Rotaria socialis]|uniref:Uncharacterized protein n=1 Tax=Rotaria socialis TaxID=392032 RepID=A0A821S4Y5_9BILA|nr:unnamed protein product [Rotaria socialis]